ncbi:hypothetical protein K432DRAFT_390231 [Lepidopterella palustris CBS 459.81]|uniref:Survival Motor Neuron Gemin2-binding domain-containing protein n=1 Tax=Lepidopterella palustris CBS 459.81 TaxID=1314670 RepID=A0A8E2EGX3_9PEZI|nr:hypothetical protein K432DRAFT_390231 [Lepidopterella palustris CBS 459.81]
MAPVVDLNDQDAWDDRALVDSWNEALKEYKKYHSIHTKGQRVQDLLSAEELKELKKEMPGYRPGQDGEIEPENMPEEWLKDATETDQPKEDELFPEAMNGSTVGDQEPTTSGHQQPQVTAADAAHAHSTAPGASIPQIIIGSVQDENLKNLMMSWYYAGYYTGMYEGQQKAAAEQRKS